MKNKPSTSPDAATVRNIAESKLSERKKKASATPEMKTDAQRLVHELEVHQIELEMQNEELVQSRAEVEAVLLQYTDLYDFAPVGYFTLARDGTIHKINLAGANLLGIERGALIDRRFGVFVSTGSRITFIDFLERVFESQQKEICEVALQKDGAAPLWAHIEAIIEDGQREACRAVVVDITERKRAEEALTTSEVRYHRLFEAARDGIVILDADTGMVVDVSPFLVEMLGYSREQFLGKHIWELGFFKDIAANKANFLELQQKEYIKFENLPLETAEGKLINVEFVSHVYEVDRHKVVQCNIRDITARKHAEDALRASEEQYRRIVDTTVEGIWILDEQLRAKYVNSRLAQMFECSPEELLGRLVDDFTFAEDLPDHQKRMMNRRGGVAEQYERRYRVKDGRSIWTIVSATPIIDGANRFCGSFAMLTDITERMRVEEELRESEERFRTLYENSTVGIYRTTPDGRILLANPTLVKMLGYSSFDELSRRNVEKNGFEPSYNRAQSLEKIEREGEVKGLESAWTLRDGSVVFVSESTRAIRDREGKTLYYDGIIEDITERKQTEDALADSEKKFKWLFEYAPVAYHVLTPVGTIADVNRRWCETLGYSKDEVLGKPIFDFILESERSSAKARFERKKLEKAQMTGRNERTYVAKDGAIKAFLVSDFMTLDKHERITSVQTTMEDITERNRAVETLEKSERRLREAQEMAHLGFWNWDVKTGDVEWSEEIFKIFCLDPGTFTPRIDSILALSPWPEDHQRDQELIKKAIETHSPGSYEQRFLRPDQSIGQYYSTFQGNYDEKGDLISIVGTVLDITERKCAEEKVLRQLEELQRWQEVTLGREDRIRQLKSEVNQLLVQRGETARYQGEESANT
jgi:PAS domain S-box-containing protein